MRKYLIMEDQSAKLYPHIPLETYQTLMEMDASPEQWKSADAAGKSQIDTTVSRYHLGTRNMTIMVIGTSGAGKSATANTLLGKNVFQEGGSAVAMTTTFQVEKTNVDGIQLTVIDTPWAWNTQIQAKSDVDLDDIFYVIVVNMASPRFGQVELNCLKTLKGHNRKPVLTPGRCMVVLTHADSSLQQDSLKKYIDEIRGDPLHELLIKHNIEVLAVNNSPTTKYERSRHRQALLMNTMVTMKRTPPIGFFMLMYLLCTVFMSFSTNCAMFIPRWIWASFTGVTTVFMSNIKSRIWPGQDKLKKIG